MEGAAIRLHKLYSVVQTKQGFMSQRKSKMPFNWRHGIYAAILALLITFSFGTIFSLVAYKPLSQSKDPTIRQFAEAIRNLFSQVGFYPESSLSPSPIPSPTSSTTSGPDPSPTKDVRPSAPDGQAQAMSKAEYMAKVDSARDRLAAMPANMQVKFTLGVHTPVRTSQQLSRAAESPIKKWEAVGLVTLKGEPIPITAGDLLEMFDTRPTTLYSKHSEPPKLQPVVQKDSYDVVAQSQDIAVIDLLIYNTETNKVYLAPNTRFADIFRDALNAVLNGELKSNNYDVHELDMSKVHNRTL